MAADLAFLDAIHEVHAANSAAWKRDERRLFGGDAAISELAQWREESDAHYKIRLNEASYLNFPKLHAAMLAGHLGRVAPMPNLGTLGEEIRTRKLISSKPNLAERIYYNVDGIGNDGSQWPAFMFGLQERAIASGHRYVLVEMPRTAKEQLTGEDVAAGHRPYLVEYSPLSVTYWEHTNGELDWAVIRRRVKPKSDDGLWVPMPTELGYYLFVRAGYSRLGGEFEAGGWFLYDVDRKLVDTGDWSRTAGRIPLIPLIAESSQGTTEWPAMSRSLTMELGQIAVSLMNRISERNFDASDAAKSVKYVLGADKDGFNLAVEFHEKNALLVPVIGVQKADGSSTVPSIYDGSSGAIAADVFTTIINSTIAEAHEIMVRQMTAADDASGVSRDKGFAEATSPLLSGLAARRETFENTVIHFLELRAGAVTPTGFVTWPQSIDLSNVLAKIDRTVERMQRIALRSPTLEAEMVRKAAEDDGLLPTDPKEQAAVAAELLASAKAASGKAKGDAMKALIDATVDYESAARIAGFDDAEVALLIAGGSNNSADDEDGRLVGQPNGNGTDPATNGTVPLPLVEVSER